MGKRKNAGTTHPPGGAWLSPLGVGVATSDASPKLDRTSELDEAHRSWLQARALVDIGVTVYSGILVEPVGQMQQALVYVCGHEHPDEDSAIACAAAALDALRPKPIASKPIASNENESDANVANESDAS